MKKVIFIVLTALVLTSCAEDNVIDNVQTSRSGISFNTSTFAVGSNDTRVSHSENPIILLEDGTNDSLYLHSSVEDNTSHISSLDSRSTPVNSGNFRSLYGSFGVTSYTQTGEKYMNDVDVDNYSNPIWSSDRIYYWPDGKTLDFYAYAPYSYNGKRPLESLEFNSTKGKVSFSYETPKGSASNDATLQPDLLFAYASHSLETTNNKSGIVPLEFSHALSAIRFVAKDITAGTIKSISIQNVYGEGDCIGYPANNDYEWDVSGQTTSFSQTFNVVVSDQQTGTQEITEKNPATTFMMIPQVLGENATLKVVIETTDGDKTLTGSLSGQEWEAGKLYTYAISTDHINWVYVFDVTEMLTIPHGKLSENYEVTSYRYRAGDESVKQPLKWTAVETNSEYKQYVTGFTYKGDGSSNGTPMSYQLGVTNTQMKTTWDDNEKTLHNKPKKGTVENPYDLSTDGGTTNQTTANCYVVDAAGTYKLPLVYGNALKNGSNNTSAYSGGGFKDYNDKPITQPYITGASDCTLVWSDAFYMFKDVKISVDKQYLIFSIDENFLQQANAIVAVRDAAGKIMWSWHIWVTEKDLNDVISLQDGAGGQKVYQMMPAILGWVDGKTIYYEARTMSFEFTQEGTNSKITMNVKQEGAEFNYLDGGSVYYQWGRKDPIVGLKNRTAYGGQDYRPQDVTDEKYKYKYIRKEVSLGESIQNPNVYYLATVDSQAGRSWMENPTYYNWDNESLGANPQDKTTSIKTVYDPSPKGFKVPPSRAFSVFVKGNESSSGSQYLNGKQEISGYEYTVYPQNNKQGTPIKLTATGQRVDRSLLGELGGLWAMYGVYYWSCHGKQAAYGDNPSYVGFSLCIRHDLDGNETSSYTYNYQFAGAQTMARPVRPIKE